MKIRIIENYRTANHLLSGRDLTDYLIRACVIREKCISCTVVRTEKGKPILLEDGKESGVYVSVSHSKALFACVVADFNIGLDIQHERNIDEIRISERYYTDKEIEAVKAEPSEFFRLWARKEAYSKYTGEGLPEIMGKLDVISRDDVVFRDMVLDCDDGGKCYMAACAEKGVDLDEIQISCGK